MKLLNKIINKIICKHEYEPFAYSPNVLMSTCVWQCKHCGDLEWREDFILFRPDQVHDILTLASTGEIVYTADVKKIARLTFKGDKHDCQQNCKSV